MLPYLSLFGRLMPTYGVLGMAGLGFGLLAALLRCKRFGLSRDDCAYLYILGAVGALVSGRNNYRAVTGLQTRVPAALPACAALPWLMEVYQTYSRDPVLLRSSVPLLACVFLLLALYQQAAFFYRRPHPRRFILFAVLGLAFGGASLADGLALFGAVLTAAFLLCTLGGLTALSYSRFAPGAAGERAQDPTVR